MNIENNKQLILVGGGGHCKSCIDVVESVNSFQIKGIIDLPHEFGNRILNYEIIGNDSDLVELSKQAYSFLITLGHMGNPTRRIELLEMISLNGGNLPVIIANDAIVSKYSTINKGTIVMHYCFVNANATIGTNCILNTKALIEHDSIIGNNCHISTNATINGNCIVEDNCFIGSSATIKNGVFIAKNTIIGAGSTVIKNITESGTYVGNPARRIK